MNNKDGQLSSPRKTLHWVSYGFYFTVLWFARNRGTFSSELAIFVYLKRFH